MVFTVSMLVELLIRLKISTKQLTKVSYVV